uniref:Protein kinase domain-containing protein n=1 Tax=Glycine max TaxID=3847 RepID=K7K1Y0_SOYBN
MSSGGGSSEAAAAAKEKEKEKARVSRTSLILWHAHQDDAAAVRKLLEEDPSLVKARDYDSRTPLHVASLHGWVEVANCLIEFGADVNAQDRWKNTPLADAEGAKRTAMIELLKSHGGLSYGQNGSHFEPSPVLPPLPNKCDWEVDPSELDFSNSVCIGKGSFGEILKAHWRGTPVAVKRILPSLSDDRLVIGMAYLHNEPNVIIHRDLKPRNVLLVNSSADHLKVGDFGLSKLIKVQSAHDVYKMTGETGSYRYMAPEVLKHRRYDKKVDVFSFAMILYEMLEGEPPFSNYEPYDGAKYVAEGHRPSFRGKGYIPELRESIGAVKFR